MLTQAVEVVRRRAPGHGIRVSVRRQPVAELCRVLRCGGQTATSALKPPSSGLDLHRRCLNERAGLAK